MKALEIREGNERRVKEDARIQHWMKGIQEEERKKKEKIWS